MNDFKKDLEWSLDERDNEIFDNFYFKAFPNLERIEIANDIKDQKDGIDKFLILKNGKRICVDEKKRRKDYKDILIEEYSVVSKNGGDKKVGWIGKHKKTDYIVYAIMPIKKVYLLPFLLLQKAWLINYNNWKDKYRVPPADNGTYWTTNLAIPTKVLLDAIYTEMETEFQDKPEPFPNIAGGQNGTDQIPHITE